MDQVKYGKKAKFLLHPHNTAIDSIGVSVDCLFLEGEEVSICPILSALGCAATMVRLA